MIRSLLNWIVPAGALDEIGHVRWRLLRPGVTPPVDASAVTICLQFGNHRDPTPNWHPEGHTLDEWSAAASRAHAKATMERCEAVGGLIDPAWRAYEPDPHEAFIARG